MKKSTSGMFFNNPKDQIFDKEKEMTLPKVYSMNRMNNLS